MVTKVGAQTYPPSVSVGPAKVPTLEDMEAEVARLRAKLDATTESKRRNRKVARELLSELKKLRIHKAQRSPV